MGKPKKQTSMRKTGLRRSHLRLKLARMVNAASPVKVVTTKRETGKTPGVKKVAVKTTKAATAPAKKAA
ncbi:MAG TPA: hypothetical protein VFZ58_04770 [Candidatus Saccharimonadales bacterium]